MNPYAIHAEKYCGHSQTPLEVRECLTGSINKKNTFGTDCLAALRPEGQIDLTINDLKRFGKYHNTVFGGMPLRVDNLTLSYDVGSRYRAWSCLRCA